jgi:plastocyanin
MRALAAAVLVALLTACGGGAPASPVATNVVDLPRSYRFEPEVITVPAGTEVTWANHDQFTHSVRLLDDGNQVLQMAPGESVSYTFETAGTHDYDCSFHPQDMQGSVIVTEAE